MSAPPVQPAAASSLGPRQPLEITMLAHGLDAYQAKKVWQPFLDWIAHWQARSVKGRVVIGNIPARHFWDMQWWNKHWPEVLLPRNGNLLHALIDDVLIHVAQPIIVPDPQPLLICCKLLSRA